jgi:hypothetical protein
MRILALDLATVTGWAIADSRDYPVLVHLQANVKKPLQPESGVERFSGAAGQGAFFDSFESWLRKMTYRHEVERLACEQAFIGPKTHQATGRKLLGMAALAEWHANRIGIPCEFYNVQSVRKHFVGFTGQRARMKRAVIGACESRGWTVADDNEADALALLDFAMFNLDRAAA